MSLRLPSQNKSFKPVRPGQKKAPLAGSLAPPVPKSSSTVASATKENVPSTPAVIAAPTVAAHHVSSPSPQISASQSATTALFRGPEHVAIHTSWQPTQVQSIASQTGTDPAAPPLSSGNHIRPASITRPPTAQPTTELNPHLSSSVTPRRIPSSPGPPSRQRSVTPGTNGIRNGKSALLHAAAAQHAAGISRPSPGRVPVQTYKSSAASAASSNYGLPPTLASVITPRATTSALPLVDDYAGMPPTLAVHSARATPAPTAEDIRKRAEELVRSITPHPAAPPFKKKRMPRPLKRTHGQSRGPAKNPRGPRKPKPVPDPALEGGAPADPDVTGETSAAGAKRTRASKRVHTGQDGDIPDQAGEGGDEASQPVKKRRRKSTKEPRIPKTRQNKEDSMPGRPLTADEEAMLRATRKRGPYNSRGTVAGTTHDKRLKVYRVARNPHPELENVEANQMVGQDVNSDRMTMADLATTLRAEGRVSARGLQLHTHLKAEGEKHRLEKLEWVEQTWRAKQIQRRKLRAEKNSDRARRRNEPGSDEEVSADSDDSEETYEPVPDRLTPPPTPEPAARLLPGGDDEGDAEDGEEEDDGERPEGLFFDPSGSEGEAEPTGDSDAAVAVLQAALAEDEEEPIEEEEDEALANLRRAGFSLRDDDIGTGEQNEDEDEEGDDAEPDWEAFQGDTTLRDEIEERQRLLREGHVGRVVEEEDDETRMINSTSFSKRAKVERWSATETDFFYMVLGETGENYTLMKAYFPGRNPQELKRKGVRENKSHPLRMDDAIRNRKPIDKAYLVKSAGFDIARPWDKELALMKEAERDVERLKGNFGDESGVDEGGGEGLEAMVDIGDKRDEGDGEDEEEDEVEGEMEGEGEEEEEDEE